MEKPLPALAKVSRPAAPLIGRAGLVARVAADTAPLVWIAAPAGSGKTGLALECARAQPGPVAWLRLDEADADLAGFLHYLEQAVVNGGIAGDWRMPSLAREHLPAPQGYLRLFARSLAARLATGACLVLDDAHKCQEAPFFRLFLDVLAEELPPGARVLVLGRSAPPEACARLLAHGRMCVVDAATLAFSHDETGRLLAAAGLAEPDKLCEPVLEFTQGWAAGIVLVASWLKRRPDAAARLDEMSQLVAGYIATEVFTAFSEAERDTLLSVCALPCFRLGWAAELAGRDDAEDILGRLAAQGALIYQYPGHEYALHPLFQRFLCEWGHERVPEARRRAWIERSVGLLADDGRLDAAVELALEHGLFVRAAALITACAETMLAEARHQTLARWIGQLPEEARGAWHHYWRGMAIYIADTAAARKSLFAACDAFAASGERHYRFMALSMIVVSYSFNGAASEPLKAVLARAFDAERDYEEVADPELRAHLTLGVYSGLTTTDPGHPDVDLWERRALAALSAPISAGMKARLTVWMSIHFFFSGRYRRISALRANFDGLVAKATLPSYQHYLAFFPFLFDELVRGDHAALAATYAESRQVSEDTGFRNMDGHYALQYADSLLLQGRGEEARAVLAKVASATPATYFNLVGHLYIVQSCAAARSGDAVAAREFGARVREAGRGMGSVAYELWGRVGECIAVALAGSPGLADDVAELRRLGTEANFPAALIHADLLDAWRLLQDGDATGALAPLAAGLARLHAESEGFLWGAVPQIMQPLCALALREECEPDAARAVVRAYRLPPPVDAPPGWPWPLKASCFGGFELLIDGKQLPSRGKSKHRQLDLIKLLAAHAPAPLSLAQAAEMLWPDSEGDAARHALETTLSRLRTTLGRDVFRVAHGTLALDPGVCWLDTVALEERLGRLESCVAAGAEIAAAGEAACQLLRGELLAGESPAWLLPRREYWRARIARIFAAAARALAAAEHHAAARLLEYAIDADPYSEPLTVALMRLHLDSGRYAEGLAVYRRYVRIAVAALGVPVAAEVEALARRLQAGSA